MSSRPLIVNVSHEASATEGLSVLGCLASGAHVVCEPDGGSKVRFERRIIPMQDRGFHEAVRKADQDRVGLAGAHLVAGRYDEGVGMAANLEAEVPRRRVRALHARQLVAELVDGFGDVVVPTLGLLRHPDAAKNPSTWGQAKGSTQPIL